MSTAGTGTSAELLTVRGLSKSFAGVRALSDVSFDLRSGEVHALLGENGAGKSTLVKSISGVVEADRGEVYLRGERFQPHDPDESSRKGVGVVFQELPLIPDLSVMENIYFNRQPMSRVRTVLKRRLRARTERLFADLGLRGVDPTKPVRDLSVAARQFVAIAKVLADDPAVVVLDEATSALGPAEVTWLLERASLLAARGKGIIFISHRLSEVRDVSDRVTVLRNGQKVGTWGRGAATTDELVAAMLGRSLEQLYPALAPTPRSRALLSVRDLSAGRRLRGANLDVREGEILGVAGLEGQGQLELFLSLYGVIRSHGPIVVDGERRHIRSPRDALKAGIGLALVPEDRKTEGILPTLSVRENLSLPVLEKLNRFGILQLGEERSVIAPVVRDLKIGRGDAEQTAASLSGGNQQKLVVGKFLLTGARLLLLYDLARGVDVGTKAEIFKMVQALAGEGYGFLFYSSDVTELTNVPHRVVVMFDGRVTAEFEAGTFSQEQLVAAMVGQKVGTGDLPDDTGRAGQVGQSGTPAVGRADPEVISGQAGPFPRPGASGARLEERRLEERRLEEHQ
ncbi:MAG TPA: sugar ABC transporter ATP-binding protein [Acidimicrobiales bacterium]|nr:sugar ABC transporter ATP-binding protein [Acidimicrobiales bacterium]